MKMYVANCTQQRHIFAYRVPESSGSGTMGGMRVQDIEIGQQIVLSGDLNKFQIEAIVAQHARYGLVAAEEIDRSRGFTGLCYSVDKPVPVSKMTHVINLNKTILDLRGQQIRKEAAVAVNQQVETSMSNSVGPGVRPPQLDKLEIEAIEEKQGSGPQHDPMEERLRVTRVEEPTQPSGARQRRRV